MALRIVGCALIVAALGIGLFVFYRNSPQSNYSLTYSPEQMLTALWNQYKLNNLEPNTFRTLDKQRDNVTTSEGQSYSMLRAVWMGDKPTFDAEWKWTEDNLSRPSDHLFSWLWGRHSNGTYGILTENSGQNSAADADTNIALALTFAYARWQDPQYLSAARAIMGDIWNIETVTDNGRVYVLADNLEKSASGTELINPSYLSPAAYRIFAAIDLAHPWQQAVDGTYYVLLQSSVLPLDAPKSSGLPPDWIAFNKTTGTFEAPNRSTADTNFGYDALRVPWNLALDYAWFKDPRDKETAEKYSLLLNAWQMDGKLSASYARDGSVSPNYNYETPAMYGGAIGYYILTNPSVAHDVYNKKLAYLFTPDWSGWRQSLSYYDDNWAWFGIGLYSNLLPNLTAGLPASFFTQGQ